MKILFLNSRGHWRNGWLTSPEELQMAKGVLRKAGMEVEATEVESIPQLEKVLDEISSDTLLWPNAYYVDAGAGKAVWLNDYIEERQLSFWAPAPKRFERFWKKTPARLCPIDAGKNGIPQPLTGTAKYLKEQNPDIRVIGIDAEGSLYRHFYDEGMEANELKQRKTYKIKI